MNGLPLTFGALGALAAAGLVATSGSRALTSLTASPGFSPAQPWARLVGAAKGGPTLEAYRHGLRNLPFDLSIEVVAAERDAVAWLKKTRRGRLGTLKICVYARQDNLANGVDQGRRDAPSDAFALFTPFTLAHRIFDLTYNTQIQDPQEKLGLTADLGRIVMEGESGEIVSETFREWAFEDCEDTPAEEEEERDQALDDCVDAFYRRWTGIVEVYKGATDVLTGDQITDLVDEAIPVKVRSLLEKDEEIDHLASRVLTSLFCPTAAGRLLRLTDHSQAMADCYATWAIGGRNPLVMLTEADLRTFSVDAQIARWLASGSARKTTEVQIARYRHTLETVAVPVLAFIKKGQPDALRYAYSGAKGLHARRAKLIAAANDVLGLQRILVL